MMNRSLNVFVAILICLSVGLTARWFQGDSLTVWYPTLAKSELTPSNIIFSIVWGLLYVCMGCSIGLISDSKKDLKYRMLALFIVQLVLNFLWSVTFFYLQSPLFGLVNIVMLDIVVIWYSISVYRVSRYSSWVMVPYVIWLLFATYLNFYIYLFN